MVGSNDLKDYAITSIDPAVMQEVMEANLRGTIGGSDLDLVTVPSGAGVAFAVPSLEGVQAVTELTGGIIHWASLLG